MTDRTRAAPSAAGPPAARPGSAERAGAGVQAGRGGPLLITADLPPAIRVWADGLRAAHYPPERNRMGAHVTLFHGLPPSTADEVRRLLGEAARCPPPHATIDGLMDLGRGTALSVTSPAMAAVHAELADRLHGIIQQRDARALRLHITVQNKVTRGAAVALQAELGRSALARSFRFGGLALHVWSGERWQVERVYPFRGQR